MIIKRQSRVACFIRVGVLLVATAFSTALAADLDEKGILRKSIPERLVVLTFDDGCDSHATVVAPILKELGFGATFYVCDFGSFKTRKDWYLSWRQMRALAQDGFEIGNHTQGHAGGAAISYFLHMEDQLLANNVPKATTACWPMYQVNTKTFPDLTSHGYVFGRGGHRRSYRPTVDHPLDVPSMGAKSMETFIATVRQATAGRVVVLTFHGVPDLEHKAVSLDPALFKEMMQYLKTNKYKAIAMRDLAEYVDPAKAALLPPTVKNVKEKGPIPLVQGDKPYVAKTRQTPKVKPVRVTPATKRKKVMISQKDVTPGDPIRADATIALAFSRINTDTPVELSDAQVDDVNGFSSTLRGPITLNGDNAVAALGRLVFSDTSSIGGPGGLTFPGCKRAWDRRGGTVVLSGKNSYTGRTTILSESVLVIARNVSLYAADESQWTADRITVGNTAELRLKVGGTDEFTEKQISLLLGNLTQSVNNNGLQQNATIGLEIAPSKTIAIAASITDSRGPGGGGYTIKKLGEGALQLTGKNTYTGQTRLEQGTLVVASFNSIANPNAFSSLGAPTDPDTGQIALGGNCTIVYTGTGESTDRELNLVGKKQIVTLEQAGTGLLTFTGPFRMSGYGADKTIVLSGSTKGRGDVTATIEDPYDRNKAARTAIKKSGTGTWILSGNNTYTGPTTVLQGTLSVAAKHGLNTKSTVIVAQGAFLELSFQGTIDVRKLTFDGVAQAPGIYSSATMPQFIKGPGKVRVMTPIK